jgi:hypothetical protein
MRIAIAIFVVFSTLAVQVPAAAQDIEIPPGVCVDPRGCHVAPEPPPGELPVPIPPRPKPAPTEAERIKPLSAAFRDLLDLVDRHRVLKADRYRPARRAQSYAELAAQVRPLYVGIQVQFSLLRDSVAQARERFEGLRASSMQLRQRIADQRMALSSATARYDAMRAYPLSGSPELARREAAETAALRAANRAYARARSVRADIMTMLAALRPPAERVRHAAIADGELQSIPMRPLHVDAGQAKPVVAPVASAPIVLPQPRWVPLLPSRNLPSIEEQLRYGRWMVETVPLLLADRERLAARNAPLVREQEQLINIADQVDAALANVNRNIDAIAPAYYSAVRREERAALNAPIAGSNITAAAITELTWLHVRDAVVRPALVAVLGENQVPHGQELAELARQLREEPLRFAAHFRRARETKAFLDVEQSVLAMPSNFMDRARDAVLAMDGASLGNAEAVRDAIFADAGAEGAALVEKASDAGDSLAARMRVFLTKLSGSGGE